MTQQYATHKRITLKEDIRCFEILCQFLQVNGLHIASDLHNCISSIGFKC